MIMWLLVTVLVVWITLFRFRRRNMYKLAAEIPEPIESLPFIGVAHTMTGNTEDIMRNLQTYSYSAMKHNGILKAWLCHILYFDPVDLEMILKTCLEKDDLHRFMRKVIGFGSVFAPVPIWRRRRKVLVPVFNPKIVERFIEVFSEQSERLAQYLEKATDKKFSIWPYICTYNLDSVFETVMGVKINTQGNRHSPFLKSVNRGLNIICERIFHLWLQPDWLFKLFRHKYKEHEMCKNEMHSFTDQIIKLKREDLKSEKGSKTEEDHALDLGACQRRSFLELLIKSSGGEKGYTNIELREEVLSLTIAGTDTSAVGIGFTFKLLGKYPEIQDKVYKELYEVFGDSDRPLVKEDLMKLKYLERVVKESLRLFPPAPFIVRKVLEDIKLPSGRVLPAGSGIAVSIWGVHRDPKYWGPDAEHFDPDRFLPERFNLANTCSYMPFSSGPRNCVGYQYALMSIKTALSAVLRRYKVVGAAECSPIPKIRVKLDIMMKAVDGFEVTLERRQKNPA